MFNEQQSWVTPWKDIKRLLCPTRGFFYDTIPNWGIGLDTKSQLTSRPRRALRTLAAGLSSRLTSPSQPWLKLGLLDKDLETFKPVQEWLETVVTRMLAIFANSNIYQSLHNVYEETPAFGTGCMMILEDYDLTIRARNFTIGEYYLGLSDTGFINSFGRRFDMTVGQLVEEFGIENVSPQVANQFKMGIVDGWIKVKHLIEPNNDRIADKSDFQNMKYRSILWEDGSSVDLALRVSGYESFPVLAPRWDVMATNIYGWGLGHNVIGDLKSMMRMEKDKLKALAKVVDPPLQVDSTVQGEVNTIPGGITRRSGNVPNAGVQPAYQINPDLNAIQQNIENKQQEIEKMFFVDLFQLFDNMDQRMTAYEVAQRNGDRLLAIGPVLNSFFKELHAPLIERSFEIMLRTGVIPPPPEEIQGQELKIEYVSILAQAQKMVGASPIEQTMGFAGSMMQAFPEIRDAIDADEALIQYADKVGTPTKIVRSKDQIIQVRSQRQQAEEAAQNAAVLPQAADMAKTMSETEMDKNSALDQVLGKKNGAVAAPA